MREKLQSNNGYGVKDQQHARRKFSRRKDIMVGLYSVCSDDSLSQTENEPVKPEIKSSESRNSWALSLGPPLHCLSCSLRIQMTEKTVVYRLKTTYRVENVSESKFALLFPISECPGVVTSLSAKINGKIVMGELVQLSSAPLERPLKFVSAINKTCDTPLGSMDKISSRVYSITRDASAVLNSRKAEVGVDVIVEIQWVTRELTWNGSHSLQVSYPFECAPRVPDEIICRATFSLPVKMVDSPNFRGVFAQALTWKVRGNRCKVSLKQGNGGFLQQSDEDLFILRFFFQNVFDEEHGIGTFGPVIIVFFLGIILWLVLTKDLLQ
ncbi:hypothetical protein LSM04_002767 [Trypanosoma melophagium]|uniref:uncharacterized protein n=1 Tax=Trypanosoma melophagium TaxID=715481 RepID=UPI00351A9360|nr:hypothetical protein LSM04_002767 [Trypanosoma melophagium]